MRGPALRTFVTLRSSSHAGRSAQGLWLSTPSLACDPGAAPLHTGSGTAQPPWLPSFVMWAPPGFCRHCSVIGCPPVMFTWSQDPRDLSRGLCQQLGCPRLATGVPAGDPQRSDGFCGLILKHLEPLCRVQRVDTASGGTSTRCWPRTGSPSPEGTGMEEGGGGENVPGGDGVGSPVGPAEAPTRSSLLAPHLGLTRPLEWSTPPL